MAAAKSETPKPGRAKGFQVTLENEHADSTKPGKFVGTKNPRELRALAALMSRPLSRENLDSAAGCSNGPDLITRLRVRGLDLPCDHISFQDRDGKTCRPGVYALSPNDRRKINRWLAER